MTPSIQNDVKIMPKAIVCEDSNLQGDVTISPGCVIHPTASIIAEEGPIIIGENCIVEEYATIAHRRRSAEDDENDAAKSPGSNILSIGANNVFEVGCTVEACHIGEKNVFESKCFVCPKVAVSNGCIIGAAVELLCAQELPENTVIYNRKCLQREAIEKQGSQILQIEFLRKFLPNYHHIRKPNHDPKKPSDGI